MDGGDREELAQNARPKEAKQNLQDRRRDADGQGGSVGLGPFAPAAGHPVAAKRLDAADTITIKPAAGPLIVSSELLMNVVMTAPMMAVKMPAMGG